MKKYRFLNSAWKQLDPSYKSKKNEIIFYDTSLTTIKNQILNDECKLDQKNSVLYTEYSNIHYAERGKFSSVDEYLKNKFNVSIFTIYSDHKGHNLNSIYNGIDDFNNKIIRHIDDDLFLQNPLFVFELFDHLCKFRGFTLDKSTEALITKIKDEKLLSKFSNKRLLKHFNNLIYKNFENRYKILKLLNEFHLISDIFINNNFKKNKNIINDICESASRKQFNKFLFSYLVSDENKKELLSSTELFFYNLVHDVEKMQKFTKFTKLNNTDKLSFLKDLNIIDNGGESFIYDITDFLSLEHNNIDVYIIDYILKAYDIFNNTNFDELDKSLLSKEEIIAYKDAKIIQIFNNLF